MWFVASETLLLAGWASVIFGRRESVRENRFTAVVTQAYTSSTCGSPLRAKECFVTACISCKNIHRSTVKAASRRLSNLLYFFSLAASAIHPACYHAQLTQGASNAQHFHPPCYRTKLAQVVPNARHLRFPCSWPGSSQSSARMLSYTVG
jgi:hypothetical protein